MNKYSKSHTVKTSTEKRSLKREKTRVCRMGTCIKNSDVHFKRNPPLHTLTFSDGVTEYVLVETPTKGIGKFAEIVNHCVSENMFEASMADLPPMKQRAVIATIKGKRTVIKHSKLERKRNGRYHPQIGYIAEDEADPQYILDGSFKEADLKEWRSIIDNCVLSKADEQYREYSIRTRFRRTFKDVIDANGNAVKQPKSRFLVCAYNDNRPVETATYVPSAHSRRLATAYGLFRGWRGATIDVKTAFLLVS